MGNLEAQLRLLLVRHLRGELRRVAQSSLHHFSPARGTSRVSVNGRTLKRAAALRIIGYQSTGKRKYRAFLDSGDNYFWALALLAQGKLKSLRSGGRDRQHARRVCSPEKFIGQSPFWRDAKSPSRTGITRETRARPENGKRETRFYFIRSSVSTPEFRQRRLILLHARNNGEYRLVIGDCV